VRTRLAAGDRTGARAALDSLIASEDSLDAKSHSEAQFLGAILEEDGTQLENRLGDLLETSPPPVREAWIHLLLGQLAFWRGDLEAALVEFRAAREEGREEEGSLWEGLTAFALGDGDAARTALTRATASGQSAIRERAWVVLGDTYRAGDNWMEAIAAYENVRRGNAGESGWWATATARQAECYEKLGAPMRANALYAELLENMPGSYEAAEAVAHIPGVEAAPPPGEAPAEAESRTFSVQVGAFRNEENARGLAERVEGAGFRAVAVHRGEDDLFRVTVGVFSTREAAESLGDSLGVDLGLGYSIVHPGASR